MRLRIFCWGYYWELVYVWVSTSITGYNRMAVTAVGLTILLYLLTCASCVRQKDYPHALMWFSYALANSGLLWYEIKKTSGS